MSLVIFHDIANNILHVVSIMEFKLQTDQTSCRRLIIVLHTVYCLFWIYCRLPNLMVKYLHTYRS